MVEIGKAIFDQRQPACSLIDKCETCGDCVAVAIDPDDACAIDLKKGACMSASAERTVDVDAAVARLQQVKDLTGEHGNMTSQSASDVSVAARHHSRAFCASCAATREPSCFFNA